MTKAYIPAVTPRLRKLLLVVFALVALLGANSLYLAAITLLEWASGVTYQNYFYQYMFLAHLVLGLLLVAPFLVFGVLHLRAAIGRRNRRAVRMGIALFTTSLIVLASGLALTRFGVPRLELRDPDTRALIYWAHVVTPLAAGWLYVLHRLAGPRIRWRAGLAYGTGVLAVVAGMVVMHAQDPRQWNVVGPREGERYFRPSLARTASGGFIPSAALTNDAYCQSCHPDVHATWSRSVHRFSSFNNRPYLTSVRETRKVSLERDGTLQASRWCAGCHDPVPFFSGAFDRPEFDDVGDPTAHAGITCSVCHAITNVNSTRGNADYTIEEPAQYPFAYSSSALLQYVNRQLIKAKPSFHKKAALKPFHRTAEFCSVCHKVNLPGELTKYKEFLRGQNHYDSFLLSGVSGRGARSFYYPDRAQPNCNGCHMPLMASRDFGARLFEGATVPSAHSHLFLGANTAIAHLQADPATIAEHQAFLRGATRIDIFGIKRDGRIDGQLVAPLRPALTVLEAGRTYLIEVVIRTLKMGHHFTQGTADSNEVWVEVVATAGARGDRVIGRSGALEPGGLVDPWAHFVNVYMLDRYGNRIDRRNAQDIFVPLYDHQVPPGAAQVVHYALHVPRDVGGPVMIDARLQYRKFDRTYMRYVMGDDYQIGLPVTTLAADRVTLSVQEVRKVQAVQEVPVPLWERWNDYGIALLLEGASGGEKGELRQAAQAFAEVERLGRPDGPLNLARVYYREGRLTDAAEALGRAAVMTPGPPSWTFSWLTGLVNKENGYLDRAIDDFRRVLASKDPGRGFDFSRDYEVINELGQALFERAKQERGASRQMERERLLREAVTQFERTLTLDAENVAAHYNLSLLYAELGDTRRAAEHRAAHARYKPDENARDRAVAFHRLRNPAADHAAQAIVIYEMR